MSSSTDQSIATVQSTFEVAAYKAPVSGKIRAYDECTIAEKAAINEIIAGFNPYDIMTVLKAGKTHTQALEDLADKILELSQQELDGSLAGIIQNTLRHMVETVKNPSDAVGALVDNANAGLSSAGRSLVSIVRKLGNKALTPEDKQNQKNKAFADGVVSEMTMAIPKMKKFEDELKTRQENVMNRTLPRIHDLTRERLNAIKGLELTVIAMDHCVARINENPEEFRQHVESKFGEAVSPHVLASFSDDL
jgi:hypothetical protein